MKIAWENIMLAQGELTSSSVCIILSIEPHFLNINALLAHYNGSCLSAGTLNGERALLCGVRRSRSRSWTMGEV